VKHGDMMKLKIGGAVRHHVLDKCWPAWIKSFKLEVHIDTDEGNAATSSPTRRAN
jgi:propanediol utilization protein